MLASVRAAEPQRERELGEIVGHQHDVGGFKRDVGAGGAHGDADVGGGQRRRVVDAVADHRDRAVLRPEPGQRLDFVAREQLGVRFVETRVLDRAARRCRVISPVSSTTRLTP